jgi:hypothetical protein
MITSGETKKSRSRVRKGSNRATTCQISRKVRIKMKTSRPRMLLELELALN